jgi:hypothetical protein
MIERDSRCGVRVGPDLRAARGSVVLREPATPATDVGSILALHDRSVDGWLREEDRMLGTAHKVEIEAPDGPAALELEHRLAALRPTAVLRDDRWVVDLGGVHSVEDVAAEVKDWLRLIGAGVTTMRVDGRPRSVMSDVRSRHRHTHADFIG